VEVLQVIETGILSVEGVLKDPAPIIVFEGQGDSSAKYTIMFSVRDYDKKYHYLTAGWKGVWLNLEKAGIELATPHRVIHLLDETPESRTD
jgi:small-conductance mechanosensitive channel